MKMGGSFKDDGIVLNGTKNQQRVKCPKCGGKRSLSVNVGLGLYHCFSCNFKGRI